MPNVQVWSLIIGALTAFGIREIITHFLNKGKMRTDEAATIRGELRTEIARRDKQITEQARRIQELEDKLAALDSTKDKIEDEYAKASIAFRLYKVDVYRTLLEGGVAKDVLDKIRLLDF